MADPIEERIVAAALLAHEAEQVLVCFSVGVSADREGRRPVVSQPQVVSARGIER